MQTAIKRAMVGPPDDDLELVRRAQRGDHGAYGELVARHQALLFAVVSRVVGPVGLGPEVEDLVQEGCIRAYRALAGFDGTQSPRFAAWLLRIATNVALDRLKAHRRRPPHPELDAVGDERFAADGDHRRDELRRAIEAAMAELGDDQRAVFVLREMQGLAYDDIARIVGTTTGGARLMMHRARQRLAKLLAPVRGGRT